MKRLLLFLSVCLAFNVAQAQFVEITVEPTDLANWQPTTPLTGVVATELKINGRMDEEDFRGISINWAGKDNLQKLDLSGITEIIGQMDAGSVRFLRNMAELAEVILPEGDVVVILIQTFQGSSKLSRINIPNSVRNITTYTFSGCTSLKSIELPASLETIGTNAFANSGLESLTIHATRPPAINSNVFANLNLSNMELYVPAASLEDYEEAAVWGDFGTIKAIVVKQEQTIENFADQLASVGDEITFPANTDQDLAVTYSIEEDKGSVATLNGNKLTIVGPGEVKITATQEGDDEYNAFSKTITVATSIDYSWLVAPAIAVEGNIAKVVGPNTAGFTKFYIDGTPAEPVDGVIDLTGKTGTVALKATTENGTEVIRLTISRSQ